MKISKTHHVRQKGRGQGRARKNPAKSKVLNDYVGVYVPTKGVKITKIVKNQNWVYGTVDGHKFNAKVFSDPSKYGIYNGRISKVQILKKDASHWSLSGGNTIYNYDRGSDISSHRGKQLRNKLLKAFPKGAESWS